MGCFDRYNLPIKKIKKRKRHYCHKCGNWYTNKAKRDKHTTDGSCTKHKQPEKF